MTLVKWYRQAGMDLTQVEDKIASREESVTTFCGKEDISEWIVDLIFLYFGVKTTGGRITEFADCFMETDPLFSEEQIEELRVLSGAVLYQLIFEEGWENPFQIEAWFSMFHFLGIDGQVRTISEEIRKKFCDDTLAKRENISFQRQTIQRLGLKPLISTKKDQEAEEEPVFDRGVQERLDKMLLKLNELVGAFSLEQKQNAELSRLLYEDNQIMWWVLSGFSDARKKSYQELPMSEAAYLAGHDLAFCVEVCPGPYSADAMLYHVLESFGKQDICIREFVDGMDSELISDDNYDTPLLFALKERKDHGEGHWHKPLKDRFQMDMKKKCSVMELAYEIYLEFLYARFVPRVE